ncbi:murein hydrolase activator EnvC family protein [Microbacterium sp.]|uniref:murein hydrolase activator EnvC family protein n=1 Tax=Microbacterium sp. TaxID=51671 RepID=UPI003A91BBB4
MPRIHPSRLAPHIAVMMVLLLVLTGAALPDQGGDWSWPVEGPRDVISPFRAPAHDYGPGHRGIDLSAATGDAVRAPADGVVAFRGVVVDRPLLTIDHGDGLVSTFEPLESALTPGTVVRAGDEIGAVAAGGHATAGSMHLGVRLNGVYINPMLLFDAVPRAVLLPCCDAVMRGGARAGTSR